MSLILDESEALTPVVPRRYVRFAGDQSEPVEAGVIKLHALLLARERLVR